MEEIWRIVDELRQNHPILRDGYLPVDILSLVEIDLKLDVIPFHELNNKYDVEAALKADFTGIYVDAETYQFFDHGPVWKLNRLRFSLAHEVGHYVMHRNLPQRKNFASLPDFARWVENFDDASPLRKNRAEWEANEFAGRLLVPVDRLQEFYEEFKTNMSAMFPTLSFSLRKPFCDRAAVRFGVNSEVISIRLDCEGFWPAG
jgi:Zn-dependent peptidase ImmA (M78 family)